MSLGWLITRAVFDHLLSTPRLWPAARFNLASAGGGNEAWKGGEAGAGSEAVLSIRVREKLCPCSQRERSSFCPCPVQSHLYVSSHYVL